MAPPTYESWGRAIASTPSRILPLNFPPSSLPSDDALLPFGLGRSYGDVCLNNGHTLLATAQMDHIRRFDESAGILECEAGISLDAILRLIVPRGWFVPVTPGTKFVTIGGCIANDIHGKNHHRAGTFGRHVRSIELLRSDREFVRCSATENAALFMATIGGMGLTGLILSAEIALRRIETASIVVQQIAFHGLREFDALSRESDSTHEYTVAWFDSFGGRDPRGLFFRGNHSDFREGRASSARKPHRLPVRLLSPFLMPSTMRIFNEAFFRSNARPHARVTDYDRFFYPLDAVSNWNRIYGRDGFLQYQFVTPNAAGVAPVAEVLDRVTRSRMASFLTVIKRFGSIPSPGMMSFPRLGTTVCFDFAASSRGLHALLNELDSVVLDAGGAIYPAKDSRMTAETFRRSFAQWEAFAKHVDPRFSSSFWRRVTS